MKKWGIFLDMGFSGQYIPYKVSQHWNPVASFVLDLDCFFFLQNYVIGKCRHIFACHVAWYDGNWLLLCHVSSYGLVLTSYHHKGQLITIITPHIKVTRINLEVTRGPILQLTIQIDFVTRRWQKNYLSA